MLVTSWGIRSAGSAGPKDPYFSNVNSLLHFDDADGTTIPVDVIPGVTWSNSDPSNAIVRNTNPKFGSGSLARPTGGTGGIYTSLGTSILTTTPYTAELFQYFTSFASANFNRFLLIGSGSLSVVITVLSSGNQLSGAFLASGTGTTPVTLNTWYHIAVASDGATTRVFLDGNLEFSFASVGISSVNYSPGRAYGVNGDQWTGYTDEARFTIGACRYTSNFTPPTAPFSNS